MDGKTRRESVREEWKKLKGLSFRKRLEYIWDYYKSIFMIIVLAVIILGVAVRLIRGSGKVTELSVAWINGQAGDGEVLDMEREFLKFGGWNDEKCGVLFDDSYEIHPEQTDPITAVSQAKLTTNIQAEMLDVMVMPEDVYESYLAMGAFMNMKEVPGEEFLNSCQELLTDDGYALELTDSKKLKSVYGDETVYLAVTVRAKHTGNIGKFVQYLLF